MLYSASQKRIGSLEISLRSAPSRLAWATKRRVFFFTLLCYVLYLGDMAKASKEPRIRWEIEEYAHREKGPDWFWALGVIALAGAAIAVIYHDTLFAIFIILSAFILGAYAARKPDIIEIAISDAGIKIRNYFYPYANIKSFGIDESELGNHLIIESDRLITPIVSSPLPLTLDTEGLSALLRTKLPEKPHKELSSHKIMEHLGF